MKAKKIFFTAILAVFTLFASSCDKDEPINSRVPYGFRFYYVDEEGKPLITEDNFDLFISKFTIIDNGQIIKVNNKTGLGYIAQEDGTFVFYHGLWDSNYVKDSFTIDYGDNKPDVFSFEIKNYYKKDRSWKIYLNGEELDFSTKSKFYVTITKPADFLEKMQNAE